MRRTLGPCWCILSLAILVLSSCAGHEDDDSPFLGQRLQRLQLKRSDANTPLTDLRQANRMEAEANDVPALMNQGEWNWLALDLLEDVGPGDYLHVGTAAIDSLVVLIASDGKELKREKVFGSGKRHALGNYPAISLTVPDPRPELYLGVQSGKPVTLPVRVRSAQGIMKETAARDLFFTFYLGVMAVMLLYNGFLFFAVEDKSYLYYVLFLIGVAGSQFMLEGYSWVLGLDSTSWLGARVVHAVGAVSGIATILFVQQFLDLRHKAPNYHKAFQAFLGLYAVGLVTLVVGNLNVSYALINLPAMAAFLVIPAARQAKRQGQPSANILMVAFIAFLLSVTVFAFKEFGLLPYNTGTTYAMPVGSMLIVVLLSIALGDRINQFKRETAKAREEKLRISRLNEQIVVEQNQQLELRVSERTEALEEKNNSLQSALEELRVAQDQLVQSEKLASIGQLTAGIAHELNNPINFVSSSAQSLRRDFEDLATVMDRVSSLDSDDQELAERIAALHEEMKRLDVAFTLQEVEELLSGIEDGAQRTSEIVKGLRIFSRMDGDAMTQANLNDLLESTLVILRSSLRDEVALVVELSPELDAIECQPGKLNQVFMNLINNAAQATKDLLKADRLVRIRTRQVLADGLSMVQVSIEDNGVGMTEETKAQMFDPFFTTKDVGEGTGLGLSIVKGILDDHKATLTIESELGQGSTFLMSFPA